MSYLLDTNVVSELRKSRRANAGVIDFFSQTPAEAIYLPVQVIGEIRGGAGRLRHRGDLPQAERLEGWLDGLVMDHGKRILGFDIDCAQVWGRLLSISPHHTIDKQIAAIALIYDLVVVTRNTADFAATRARLLNPFV